MPSSSAYVVADVGRAGGTDASLLMSCAKDNRTLLWDLFSLQPVFELPPGAGAAVPVSPITRFKTPLQVRPLIMTRGDQALAQCSAISDHPALQRGDRARTACHYHHMSHPPRFVAGMRLSLASTWYCLPSAHFVSVPDCGHWGTILLPGTPVQTIELPCSTPCSPSPNCSVRHCTSLLACPQRERSQP